MVKFVIALIGIAATIFGSSQPASFECNYKLTSGWVILGSTYYCKVQNSVNITSLDAAQVDDISGTHLPDYKIDDVKAFDVEIGNIHYFPRGLNKFFKNLKGIGIYNAGLKEIHKTDLMPFPNLKNLYLWSNKLEILEEDLFEFNLNLEYINLQSNKISHIDPHVFDKLTKIHTLFLDLNACIKMEAYRNPTKVQDVIKTARIQCIHSEYSDLNQEVRNLKIESKNLNSENLKKKLKKLKNEIKNSEFPNFFQDQLQSIKTAQVEKEQEEAKTTTTTQQPATPTESTTTAEVIKIETCSALELKVDNIATTLNDLLANSSKATYAQCKPFKEYVEAQNDSLDTKLEILNENLVNTRIAALREIRNIKNEFKAEISNIKVSIAKTNANIGKIMKALNIAD